MAANVMEIYGKMCIRDRSHSAQTQQRCGQSGHRERRGARADASSRLFQAEKEPDPGHFSRLRPVSYTHLDVYKRQVLLDEQELARIPGNARAQKLALMLPHTRRTELTTCFEFAAAGRIPYTCLLYTSRCV